MPVLGSLKGRTNTPPTTTFTNSIFEIFSNFRLRFLVLTYRRRIHGAVLLPGSDFVICYSMSTAVLEILQRSRFLQLLSLRFSRLGKSLLSPALVCLTLLVLTIAICWDIVCGWLFWAT